MSAIIQEVNSSENTLELAYQALHKAKIDSQVACLDFDAACIIRDKTCDAYCAAYDKAYNTSGDTQERDTEEARDAYRVAQDDYVVAHVNFNIAGHVRCKLLRFIEDQEVAYEETLAFAGCATMFAFTPCECFVDN